MSGECLSRTRRDRLIELVDEVYARLEKLGQLIGRDSLARGGRADFVKIVLLEEAYDRLVEARKLVSGVSECREG